MIYSNKQEKLLKLFKEDKLKRINLLSGSVRSGKTWISLVLWGFWILTRQEGNLIMVGRTLDSLKRNCLDILLDLFGKNNFSYSLYKKEAILFGNKIYLEGELDRESEKKIRGLTLAGAYVDELSNIDENFYKMLLSRLSEKDAKLFATTNPENPHHWLNKEIQRKDEIDLFYMEFFIDDNTFLPKDYIENIKKEYTGVFFDRYILGKWVAAEGAIYTNFIKNKEKFVIDKIPEIEFAQIGIDFGGNKSAHAFILTGFTKNLKEVIIIDEFYHKGEIDSNTLATAFVDFVKRNSKYKILGAYADSAEPVLIKTLTNECFSKKLAINIHKAKKGRIIQRIRFYNHLMENNSFKIHENCVHLINALETAIWNPDSITDERLDNYEVNIDSLDAMEYSTENLEDIIFSQIKRGKEV